jgi:hypothetical protein
MELRKEREQRIAFKMDQWGISLSEVVPYDKMYKIIVDKVAGRFKASVADDETKYPVYGDYDSKDKAIQAGKAMIENWLK